ncbi:hypothetical protein KSP40_PGU006664 [Platanthera guangdongensis]|uniref:DUF1421 domain-containing protein n=1 Tax=Platanthera guangdongensis TaxID=2320717 RepID=A0ABR2LC55_9ASPA
MASSGSAALSASAARSFDFGSDDVLCSYDDYTPHQDQSANGRLSDPSDKDLHENRVGRPLANIYGQQEEFSREDVVSAVDKCMKKYADNLTRNLEGISGRLTQLELYCFKLERSIGEFRSDMIREQSEEDLKLASLEKHVHEVHRAVQIIRDKQELSETQKELTKLQLSQKDSTNPTSHSQKNEGLASANAETKSHNDQTDATNQQLALALPHQIPRAPDQNQSYKEPHTQQPPLDRFVLNPQNPYYAPRQPQPLEHQSQNLQPELHYAQPRAQMHDLPIQALLPQFRAQWSQPMQPQQPSLQAQTPRPSNPPVYAHYSPNQPANTVQPEAYQSGSSSMAPPASYTAVLLPSGYGVSGGGISHHPSQHTMQRQTPPPAGQVSFSSGYAYPMQPTMQDYATYLRSSHPQSFQVPNNHPYGEIIDKAVSMGYPREQVIDVVREIGETGQPVDLNALLDRLNALGNAGARRPW